MKQVTALNLPVAENIPEATQKYLDLCQEKLGLVPNVIQAYTFDIAKLNAFTAMYNDLMLAPSGLSKLEREMVAVVVSSINRCWYCQVAHGAAVREIFDLAAVVGFYSMSNRVASAIGMEPNEEYHAQAR